MIIDHIQLAMPAGREAEARAYFGGLLGLAEEPKPAPLANRGGCWFRGPGCVLHLGVDSDFRPQTKAHPAFLVHDLADLARRLEAAGLAVRWDDALPGVARFYTADPFGNRLELIQDGGGFSQQCPHRATETRAGSGVRTSPSVAGPSKKLPSSGCKLMQSQAEKGQAFRALHEGERAFIIPNPWDIGTARLLAHLGFEALATTSAGYAFSVGQRDLTIGRDQMIAHVRDIVTATELPVSADLENGFGDDAETVAETIRLAAATGLVGGSIEDATGRPDAPIYRLDLAVERVRAAVAAARALPFPFTLTARAENYLVGRPDLEDTIRRLRAYQEAGADVLYAPGLSGLDDIVAVVDAVERPVNVVMGLRGAQLSLAALSEIGVKRISVGSALSRAALGAFLRAAREMRQHGTFTFAEEAVSYQEISAMFHT